jgi:2-C-methyl-D-erythritol 4-phosphate cytidylyltransferase
MSITKTASEIIKRVFTKPPKCSAVILAAGNSSRMNYENKMFIDIGGIPLLVHTLLVFQNCNQIYDIIVVTNEDSLELVTKLCEQYNITKVNLIITGGTTRLESALNGVTAVSQKSKLVAIHDGARPCISNEIIINTISKATKHHAAAPGVPIVPTLKRVKNGIITQTVDRDGLYEIQTPQIFNADLIKGALTNAINKGIDVTDDAMAVEFIGVPVYITAGSGNNIKVTSHDDIVIAEALLLKADTVETKQ